MALLPIQQMSPTETGWEAVRLGVYASLPTSQADRAPLATKGDLLKSCRIHLDLLLRSYLEEVAGEFFDIEQHSSRIETFGRLKGVENILGASVKPKLDAILNIEKGSHLYRLAHEIWRGFSVSIVSAALGRVFALRLVNELYRCLGVWDRVQDYEDQWLHISARLRELYDGSFDDDLFSAGSDPDLLRRAREEFAADDIDGLDRLANEAGERLWLRRFIEFARFVSMIRREHATVGTPRLFISAQHRVPSATAFAQSVPLLLQGGTLRDGRPRVEVSQVGPGAASDEHIERLVKAQIWQSDAVLGVIPKDWTGDYVGGPKNLEWVASETDHALLLSRKVHLFVQRGTDHKRVREEFGKKFRLLSPAEDRLPEAERRRLLLDKFKDFVHDEFQYDGDAPEIKRLEEVVDSARRRHAQDLVRGLLQQFSREDRYVILKVQQIARYKTARTEILRRLARDGVNDRFFRKPEEATLAFGRAWENSRKRFLRINGHQIGLIAREGQSYRGNLRTILDYLRPELEAQRITKWNDELIEQILQGL